jgi:hypothetical protein
VASPDTPLAQPIVGKRDPEYLLHLIEPLGGPAQVLNYLTRYTHRVAISNERLVGLQRASRVSGTRQ